MGWIPGLGGCPRSVRASGGAVKRRQRLSRRASIGVFPACAGSCRDPAGEWGGVRRRLSPLPFDFPFVAFACGFPTLADVTVNAEHQKDFYDNDGNLVKSLINGHQ